MTVANFTLVPSAGLPAPVIAPTDVRNVLDASGQIRVQWVSALDGLTLIVPAYENRHASDTIRMCTQASSGHQQPVYGPSVRIGDVRDDDTTSLIVRRITIAGLSLAASELRFYYQVTRADGTTLLSAPLEKKLVAQFPDRRLEAPVVLNAMNSDGSLAASESTLRVRVDRPAEGWDRDTTLYVLGTSSTVVRSLPSFEWLTSWWKLTYTKGFDYTSSDAPSIETALTKADGFDVEASKGRTLRVWYTSIIDHELYASDVLLLTIDGEQAKPETTGLVFGDDVAMNVEPYTVAVGVPPPNPPPQATISRPASGGKPPYRYASSNRYVAAVDEKGTVVATGNGKTRISVTDATGATSGFDVVVTGATVLMCVRNAPFVDSDRKKYQCAAIAAMHTVQWTCSVAGVIPSLGQLRALWKQYRSLQPGLARKLQWEQDSDDSAYYWTRDSTREDGAFRVNLNAAEEDMVVEAVGYADLDKHAYKSFVAMEEGNHWNGFDTWKGRTGWYQDGEYARPSNQPWRAVNAADVHDKDQYGAS